VKTKLIQSKDGPGPTIKQYTEENNVKLLVLASPKPGLKRRLVGGVTEYCHRFCSCPVVVVKKERRMDIKTSQGKVVHVAIALDKNSLSDNAVNWFLANATLSAASTLVLVHAVEKTTEKRQARKFLASYQPRCVASKKDYTMKSGLIYFKGKTIQESIVKYCHDYSVDLLILAPGMQSYSRLTTSTSEGCSRNVDCDFMIWKDKTLEGKSSDSKSPLRRLSLPAKLDGLTSSATKPKGKPRRFSMGADEADMGPAQEGDERLGEGPPEEVSYVFGYDTLRTLSP